MSYDRGIVAAVSCVLKWEIDIVVAQGVALAKQLAIRSVPGQWPFPPPSTRRVSSPPPVVFHSRPREPPGRTARPASWRKTPARCLHFAQRRETWPAKPRPLRGADLPGHGLPFSNASSQSSLSCPCTIENAVPKLLARIVAPFGGQVFLRRSVVTELGGVRKRLRRRQTFRRGCCLSLCLRFRQNPGQQIPMFYNLG